MQGNEATSALSPADEKDPSPVPSPSATSLALHRAAFDDDGAVLRQLLMACPADAREARDAHGNTALHVAVLCRAGDAIGILLDAGLSPETRNARKWSPLDEAVALGDKNSIKVLLA
jgi:ankyrin repeat protein